MNFLNLERPVNKLEPKPGRLLIAEPFLNDPNFARAVIFLCEHSAEGSVGFVLNNLAEIQLGDLLPQLGALQFPVSQGGPVQVDTLHILHRLPVMLGGKEVAGGGVYWGGSYKTLQDMVAEGGVRSLDVRLFIGYSGWSPGQLEKEMKEGSWIVTEMSKDILFETKPHDIWKRAISLLGSEYAYLANMPVNPQLN